jgi:hypothetical protein
MDCRKRALGVFFLALLLGSGLSGNIAAQNRSSAFTPGLIPGRHRGEVISLVHTGALILSAGEDGFLGIWDEQRLAALERFQISPWAIQSMVKHPLREEICVIEKSGAGRSRVSAWDYAKKEKRFSRDFDDPVDFINYSAAGTYVITADITGITLLDSQTGETARVFESSGGTAGFAATGRAERNMFGFFSANAAAEIVYWDLESGNETNRFSASAGLASPVIFGNNRYLAGLDRGEPAVLDAASGEILGRNSAAGQNVLLCSAGDEFYCLNRNRSELYRFGINRRGGLENREKLSLFPEENADPLSAIRVMASNGSIVFGSSGGNLLLAGRDGKIRQMAHNDQTRITEIAVSGSTIAFITENKQLGFLPLDYRLAKDDTVIFPLALEHPYSRISPLDSGGRFLFWQEENAAVPPMIKSANQDDVPVMLEGVSRRFPLRAVSCIEEKILFLDSGGNVTVTGSEDRGKNRLFSFSAAGAIDAAFIDGENIIIGRAALSSNTPFLKINIKTGETVPLAWPAAAGIMVRPFRQGGVYAAAFSQDKNGAKTQVLYLDTSAPGRSVSLAEFQGEDPRFSIAGSDSFAATDLGGEETVIFSGQGTNPEKRKCERSPGLPLKITGSSRFFIQLDTEGNIGWFENSSGRLLALFRLYPEGWLVQS